MAITVTKVKSKTAAPKAEIEEAQSLIQPHDMSTEELADQYGSLEDQIEALMANPVFAKFDEVKKELDKRLVNDFEPLDILTIKGAHWTLEIGAAARNPAKLTDVPKLASFLGMETFYKIAKVTLTDVKKYCTPDQVALVVDEEQGFNSRRKITAKYHG